jgi:drug/metabolite transporter (DMT)-like permease
MTSAALKSLMKRRPTLMHFTNLLLLGLAMVAVAIADVFLKHATVAGDLNATLRSPWLIGAIALYLFQIAVFTFAFLAGWKLSLIGSLQIVLYACVVVGAGLLLFRETLSLQQVIGLGLALSGAILVSAH